MQRTILSQWFLFLVPDLKILRLHIVSVVCVSGALVDLEFPFPFSFFSLSLSLICLSLQIFHSFFPSCFFSFLSINLFRLHAAAFAELHTQLSFSPLLFTDNLDWTIRFDATKQSHVNNPPPPFFFVYFLSLLFTDLAACSSKAFLSFAEFSRKTHQTQQISLWC